MMAGWFQIPRSYRNDLCFLFTAGESGSRGSKTAHRIRFMMHEADAQKWCGSDLSKGVYMGHEWAYFYTHVEVMLENGDDLIDVSMMDDNGKWDGKIASTGAVKIPLDEFPRLLCPLGFTIIDLHRARHEPTGSLSLVNKVTYGDQPKPVAPRRRETVGNRKNMKATQAALFNIEELVE